MTVETAPRPQLGEPYIVGDHTDRDLALAGWDHKVWLATPETPGVIEVYSRSQATKWDHSRPSFYRSFANDLFALSEAGMGERFADLGITVDHDPEAQSWRITFLSTEALTRLSQPARPLGTPEPIGSIHFVEHTKDAYKYGDLELLVELSQGGFFISTSTKKYRELADEHLLIIESIPRCVHDVILHVPAWECLPPEIVIELVQAARGIVAEWRAATPAGQPAIKKRMGEMVNNLDYGINTSTLSGVVTSEDGKYPGAGIHIGRVTGKTSREDALRYEALIRKHVANPGRRAVAARHLQTAASRGLKLVS